MPVTAVEKGASHFTNQTKTNQVHPILHHERFTI